MLTIIIDLIIIIILVALSAFFSSSETALTTISPHRLRTMVQEKYRHADTLARVLDQKEKMLSVILICNNIVNIAASALTTVFVQKLFGSWAISAGTGVLTLVVLVFGEIAPKTIATYKAEKLSLLFSPVIFFLMKVFTPLAIAVNFLAKGVLIIFRVRKNDKSESYTENEIRSIVEVSSEEGVIEDEEKEMINNVFDLSDTTAREAMVPRVNVIAINEETGYEEIKQICMEYMFTRIPVYDAENVSFTGMLNIKDFIFMDSNSRKNFSVKNYLRPLPYTFEQKKLSELFMEMKSLHINMMAVMDEYGVTVGIITMEDLLEEIVGDIRDEYDEDEGIDVVQTGNDEFEVPGSMNISDLNEMLGLNLESQSFESVGGLLMEKLDRLPEEGDSIETDNVTLTAVKISGTKIETIRIRKNES